MRPNAWLWTVAALAGLAWGVIALVFAAIGPAELVPRIFFSYHIEHFAAFYVVTILAAAAFPRARLGHVSLAVMLMAFVLSLVRFAIPHHRLADAEDLAADLAGAVAALAAVIVGRYRQIVSQAHKSRANEKDDAKETPSDRSRFWSA